MRNRRSAAWVATLRLERSEAAAKLVRQHRREAAALALDEKERELVAQFETAGALPLGFGVRPLYLVTPQSKP